MATITKFDDLIQDEGIILVTSFAHSQEANDLHCLIGLSSVVLDLVNNRRIARMVPSTASRKRAQEIVTSSEPLRLDGTAGKPGPSACKLQIAGYDKGIDIKELILVALKKKNILLSQLDLANPGRRNEAFLLVNYIIDGRKHACLLPIILCDKALGPDPQWSGAMNGLSMGFPRLAKQVIAKHIRIIKTATTDVEKAAAELTLGTYLNQLVAALAKVHHSIPSDKLADFIAGESLDTKSKKIRDSLLDGHETDVMM